jgi:6-pyruvoyl-tetrahydropterin synthase
MQLELVLLVTPGPDGMATNSSGEALEFGDMKKKFRTYIDTKYDHHLILNEDDPWAQPIYQTAEVQAYMTWKEMVQGEGPEEIMKAKLTNDQKFLPGLVTVAEDPTVENLAKWIAEWAAATYKCDAICRLEETKTNGAEVLYHWNGFGTSMVRGAI